MITLEQPAATLESNQEEPGGMAQKNKHFIYIYYGQSIFLKSAFCNLEGHVNTGIYKLYNRNKQKYTDEHLL